MFLGCLIAGRLGLLAPFTVANVSPVWILSGVSLSALLLAGPRIWSAIACAALVVNIVSPIPPVAAMAMATANTAGPLVAVLALRRIRGFRTTMSRVDDMLALIFIAGPLSAAVSATIGVTALYLTQVEPWSNYALAWSVWWVGDINGVLLIAPLVLTSRTRWVVLPRDLPQLFALVAGTVAVSWVIFGLAPIPDVQLDMFAFGTLPLVVWGAARFAVPGAALVVLIIGVIALAVTSAGLGPFVRYGATQNIFMLQAFIAMLSACGVLMGALFVQRSSRIRSQGRRAGTKRGERSYRQMVEASHDGIWKLDAQLRTVFVNTRMAAMLGRTVQEMHGRPLSEFLADPACAEERANLAAPVGEVPDRRRVTYRRGDGSAISANVSSMPARGTDDNLGGTLTLVSDISDQTRAEQDKHVALERVDLLSKAVEQTTDSVVISDVNGCIEDVNPAFEQTTGFQRGDALGHRQQFLESDEQNAALNQQIWDRLREGTAYRGTQIHHKKSGVQYWANQTITPIKNAAGRITHFVTVLKDVTDARRYHEQEVRLGLARAVQERFHPRTPARLGFEIAGVSYAADATGGDYYDFIDGPGRDIYVAVGDVSGHGFDAALIMAMTRAYLRAFATLGMDVGEVLRRVNSALREDLEPNRFVTMLLVHLRGDGHLTYSSAGHIPGLLLNAEGEVDKLIESTGVPLALFAGAEFETRHEEMGPGQVLVLVTDGVTERRDRAGDEFCTAGIVRYVSTHTQEPAPALATGVCDAAQRFGHDSLPDDITAVVVRMAADNRMPRLGEKAAH